ncbi:thylakoid membrane protein ThyD [Dactylococcopsis salina]|uniref:TIGR01777 family protein n=1 Tax=Dactylococcopsis salina (strain PCC 8305) TaxID=13035 RepID=K9YVA6_DACS8|nr:TIGR01777 family oxidoreductase [Dactylococcopsis salina]AFZ50260.1 TIGR01777 family protein [Dactylococcopsis salina PCC 8305]
MKIAITGGTGFVGTRLIQKLSNSEHNLVVFTRDKQRGERTFPKKAFPNVEIVEYNPLQAGSWQNEIANSDAIVNLAGAGIADQPWTPERKQEILDSRLETTKYIVEAIKQADTKPQVLVNASAVGYYGTSETATFDETSGVGNDFLASVCQKWEATAKEIENTETRLVILRFGIVLGEGGALGKMLTPFRLFAGGPLGTGEQWFSWIHLDDLVNLIQETINSAAYQGVYNATAPNPVRMSELCETLGEVMQRPSWLPVPEFALKLLLGEAAQAVLEGQNVIPKRTQEQGFTYQYPTLKPALANIVKQ